MLTLRVQVGPHISHLYDHYTFLAGIPVSSLATDQNILSIAARKTHLKWRSDNAPLVLKNLKRPSPGIWVPNTIL